MAKTYYGYKKREGLKPIDYLGATKDLTEGLTGIFEEREKERGLIEEEIREAEKQTKDVPMGDSSTLNEAVLDSSSGAAEALRAQTQLMRNGIIKPSEFTKFKQNVMDGMVDLKEGAVSLNKHITETSAAVEAGTASVAQAKFLEDAMQDTWFDRTRMYTDPKSGHMMIVRTDEKGKDIKGSENSVRNFKNQTKQIIARYDIEEETSSFTETLGEDIRLSMKSGVKTVKDALSKKTIDPVTKKEYTGFDLVNKYVDGASDADLASILVDELSGNYSPTGDVNDKGKAGMVYYEADPTAVNKNSRVPKLTPEQKDAAREYLRANIYAQIDYTETAAATTGTSATERKAAKERDKNIDAAKLDVTTLRKIFEAKTSAEVNQGLARYSNQLMDLIPEQDKKGSEFIRAELVGTDDNRTINVIYRDQYGKKKSRPAGVEIPDNFQDFVDSGGVLITGNDNLRTLREEAMSEIDDPAALIRGNAVGVYEIDVLEEALPAVDSDVTLSDAMDTVVSELDWTSYANMGRAYSDMSTAAVDMFKKMGFEDYSISQNGDNILISVEGYDIPAFNMSKDDTFDGNKHDKRRGDFKRHMSSIYTALTTGKKVGGGGGGVKKTLVQLKAENPNMTLAELNKLLNNQ